MNTYYISGGGDDWQQTTAKTLIGAKRAATNAYQVCSGGRVEVGEDTGRRDVNGVGEIVKVAVKRGYDKWQGA